MKLVKKALCVFMCMIFLIGMVSCVSTGKEKEGTEGDNVSINTNEVQPQIAEIRLLQGLSSQQIPDMSQSDFISELIEKKLNIKIVSRTFVPYEDLDSKVSLMLASGDKMPDLFQVTDLGIMDSMVEDNIALPMNELMEKYGTNLMNSIKEDYHAVFERNGKIYGIQNRNNPHAFVTQIRKDWLDTLELDIPVTLGEFYETARAFTFNDPDRNGEDDTYGIGAWNNLWSTVGLWFGAYGAQPDCWYEEEGQIVLGETKPEVKDALRFMNKVYTEGLMHPEALIHTRQQHNSLLWLNGKLGIQNLNYATLEEGNGNYENFKANNPNALRIAIPPPIGPNGHQAAVVQYAPTEGEYCFISKDSKHPEKVMELLDYLATEEGYILTSYGIKDEHFHVDENGTYRIKEDFVSKQVELGLLTFVRIFQKPQITYDVSPLIRQVIKDYADNNWHYVSALYEQTESMLRYSVDLQNIRDQFFMKAISGDLDIDMGYENFINSWMRAGGEQVIKEANDLYLKKENK